MKKWAHELNREFSKEEVQIVSKYTKKCSIFLVIKEVQIKTTLRFLLTPVRMGRGKDVAKQELLCTIGVKALLWKAVWRFLKKLETELPCDPVMRLLSIYPKEHKTAYKKDTCTLIITALFITAKLWKQTRCPKTDEWIKKLWYIYTMEYYLVTRNNDIRFEGKWMQLEDIM
jgi:hypothetical protein